MYYRRAQSIHVGQWLFYPEAMIAQNIHNGNRAYFHRRSGEDLWQISCVNCPADWMLRELAEWFGQWITGGKKTPQEWGMYFAG
jgi:hypothetical protein